MRISNTLCYEYDIIDRQIHKIDDAFGIATRTAQIASYELWKAYCSPREKYKMISVLPVYVVSAAEKALNDLR